MLGPDHVVLMFSSAGYSQMSPKTLSTFPSSLSLSHTHTHTHTHTFPVSYLCLFTSVFKTEMTVGETGQCTDLLSHHFAPVQEINFPGLQGNVTLKVKVNLKCTPSHRGEPLVPPGATVLPPTGWLHIENRGRCRATSVEAPWGLSRLVLSTQASKWSGQRQSRTQG